MQTHVPTLSEVLTDIRTGRGTPFQAIYSWCGVAVCSAVLCSAVQCCAVLRCAEVSAVSECQQSSAHRMSTVLQFTAVLLCCALLCRLLAKVARNLDVMPGEEFRVALREAHAIGAQARFVSFVSYVLV